jgi:signal transduction histidine kinase/ActR/RegA family two-component response regulator
LVPELDEQRRVSSLIFVASDVTQYKRIEEELRRAKVMADAANAAKSAFLANMSHEIRTPLGAVLGFSELLLNPELPEADRAMYVSAMQRNGKLLSTIINDILDLSKVEAGKLDIECEEVSLSEVLTDVTSLLSLQASDKGICLRVENDGPVPARIRTDALRLRQVLINIVGNAVKFTSVGSVTVRIRLRGISSRDTRLEFEVKDTGPGIDPSQAAKLFEPFTQADPSTKRRYGGTGLGLVLAKRLARVLGGDVVLDPSSSGAGSTFRITIDPGPVTIAEQTTEYEALLYQRDERAISEIRLDGAEVLLVEDALDNRLLVSRILRIAGAQVDIAENGQQAVEKARCRSYDTVLMDLQMPLMDGFEATALLRSEGYRVPIIALKAHAMKEDRQRCLGSGFDDHVCKPIDRRHLLERVAACLGASRAALGAWTQPAADNH